MQPARFRQADISLVKINNAKSMSPAVSSGRSAGSFPEQRLVIEPIKAIAKLNLGHRNEFEIEFYKISCHSSRSSDNAELVISRCCFAEDGKEMYKKL